MGGVALGAANAESVSKERTASDADFMQPRTSFFMWQRV